MSKRDPVNKEDSTKATDHPTEGLGGEPSAVGTSSTNLPSLEQIAHKDQGGLSIKEGYERSDYYSGQSSEINRQLAFAGIAVIWVFKEERGGQINVPLALFLPGVLIVTGLAVDLLHYVIAGEIWRQVTRKNEQEGKDAFKVKPFINWMGDTMYWLKIALTIIAYILLIRFLSQRLFQR